MHVCVSMCVCMYVCVGVCVFVCMCTYCKCTRMHVCVCESMCVLNNALHTKYIDNPPVASAADFLFLNKTFSILGSQLLLFLFTSGEVFHQHCKWNNVNVRIKVNAPQPLVFHSQCILAMFLCSRSLPLLFLGSSALSGFLCSLYVPLLCLWSSALSLSVSLQSLWSPAPSVSLYSLCSLCSSTLSAFCDLNISALSEYSALCVPDILSPTEGLGVSGNLVLTPWYPDTHEWAEVSHK